MRNEDLYEGDIRLTEEQKLELLERKAISGSKYRWPVKPGDTFPEVDYTYGDREFDSWKNTESG